MNVAGIIVALGAVAALAGLAWFFFGPRNDAPALAATVPARRGTGPDTVYFCSAGSAAYGADSGHDHDPAAALTERATR